MQRRNKLQTNPIRVNAISPRAHLLNGHRVADWEGRGSNDDSADEFTKRRSWLDSWLWVNVILIGFVLVLFALLVAAVVLQDEPDKLGGAGAESQTRAELHPPDEELR